MPQDSPTGLDPAPYVARCETDLVVMVPLVLGFHPADSVVLMTFSDLGSSFHARVDLPLDTEHHPLVTASLVEACRANAVRRAAAVVYTDDHDLALSQARSLVEGLGEVGIEVLDALRVHDRAWFALLGAEAEPPVGTPFDAEAHPFTARGVFEGRVVHGDRDEVRDLLVGRESLERAVLAHAARSVRRRLVAAAHEELVREAWWLRDRLRLATRSGDRLDTGDAGRVLGLVADPDFRDVAWVDLRRSDAREHVGLWLDLVRRSPWEASAGPCALLALAAYVAGDGALAWCAVDRCREVEPGHTLARLVADALAAALSPRAWPVADASLSPLLGGGRR